MEGVINKNCRNTDRANSGIWSAFYVCRQVGNSMHGARERKENLSLSHGNNSAIHLHSRYVWLNDMTMLPTQQNCTPIGVLVIAQAENATAANQTAVGRNGINSIQLTDAVTGPQTSMLPAPCSPKKGRLGRDG